MKTILTLAIVSLLAPASLFARNAKINNATVSHLNLPQFMGTWYEIARFDHRFERGMSYAQARYTLKDDGKVRVDNTGWKDGKFKRSVGKAFAPDPGGQPGLLRVSFFGPFYSDYRVLMLTDDYKYALVGSKNANYLWILARSPEVKPEIMDSILEVAKCRGYDTSKLIWVDQTM